MSAPVTLRLDWATHEATKYACLRWHYARKVPVGKLVKIGVWENDRFIGVVIFAPGSAGVGYLHRKLGLHAQAICELQRIALRDHVSPVTRIMSIALKMVARANPGLDLVVSYADPAAGHAGTIYKAGNWFGWGQSAPSKAYRYADGLIMHERSVSRDGTKKRMGQFGICRKIDDAVEVIRLPAKHRFLFPLTDRGRQVISDLRTKQAMTGVHPEQRRGSADRSAPIEGTSP